MDFLPSNALLLSRSIVASRLMVSCGVPSEGENVYWDGISKLTITMSGTRFRLTGLTIIYCFGCLSSFVGKYCEALSATQTNLAVFV